MPFILLGLFVMLYGICKWIWQLLFKRKPKAEEWIEEVSVPISAKPIPVRPDNVPPFYQFIEGGVSKRARWGTVLYNEITYALTHS